MAPNAPYSSGKQADGGKLGAAQLSPPQRSTSPSPIPLPSKQEREGYYLGLPSPPALVARTSTAVWEPLDTEGNPRRKGLGPLGPDKLGGEKQVLVMTPEIIKVLDAHGVKWTSINYARIGDGEPYYEPNPPILWIGVCPGALTDEDGSSLPIAGKVAVACKQVLEKYGILDVECEIRESVLWPDLSRRGEPAKATQTKPKKKQHRSRKY